MRPSIKYWKHKLGKSQNFKKDHVQLTKFKKQKADMKIVIDDFDLARKLIHGLLLRSVFGIILTSASYTPI